MNTIDSQESTDHNHQERARNPTIPEHGFLSTPELIVFLRRHLTIFEFLFFTIELSESADRVAKTAAEALAFNGTPKDIERLEEYQKNPKKTFQKLRTFAEFQSENTCIRLVDNFLTFISKTIQSCMIARPEILNSNESVKIDEIMKFSNISDLHNFLIDRKVNELSYLGIRDVAKFLKERTNLELFSDKNSINLVSISVELRNIYTHNRGVINSIFLKRTKELSHKYKFIEGKRFHVDYDMSVDIANELVRIAQRLDEQVATKFDIKRNPWSHSARK